MRSREPREVVDQPRKILLLTAARLFQSVAVIAHPSTVMPELVSPPHLIFRLLFLRVQDIMQHDCGFFWGRRHLMYVTVAATDHWPRSGRRHVCPGGVGEEERSGRRREGWVVLNRLPASALSCHKWHVSQTLPLYNPRPVVSFAARQLRSVFQMSSSRGKSSYLCGVTFATNNAVPQHFQLGTVRHDGSRLDIIHDNSHFLSLTRATRHLSFLEDLLPSSILPE